MKELMDLQRHLIGAELHGHCRIDYTDPVTGKVLERIEGDNHVFMDQFMAQDFQSQVLSSNLLITNGEKELDTDLPWIPGTPIGYGTQSSQATGIYQGSFRQVDSYRNIITQQGVTSLYVYDFLATQIPDVIRYVGLTASGRTGVNTSLFTYKWPITNYYGIYDIERKVLFFDGTCSLSRQANGDGNLYIYKILNEPTAVSEKIDLFTLCERPDNYWTADEGYTLRNSDYVATWGYDYENQAIVLKLMRYCDQYRNDNYSVCRTKFKDDFWVISKDGVEILKHFQYKWTADERAHTIPWQYDYHFWTGEGFPPYVRLYGDKLYGFSQTPPEYNATQYNNVFYVYQYDITTGDIAYESYNTGHNDSHPLMSNTETLYCYKGYTFPNGGYNRNGTGWGFSPTLMGVNPMYDVYTEDFYTNCPTAVSAANELIEKGQTSVYGKTWNIKPALGNVNMASTTTMPFAYTAYRLPSDAPVRPEKSAVTIAYGLTVKW